ncbi:hypothetical protein BGZ98_004636, partial [Dissophora globulifera]
QEFLEIMEILDKRMNDKGKNWRHVFKALTVLDYLLHVGSESVVKYAQENLYIVKTLKEFQYIDEEGKDQGSNVRQKAKDITSLLSDEERLKEERRSRNAMQDRMGGRRSDEDVYGVRRTPSYERPRDRSGDRPGMTDDDRDLQRALEESRRMAHGHSSPRDSSEEDDLQTALELSKKEEQDRIRAQQPTGFNNPYLQFQQQQLQQQQLQQQQLLQQQMMQQQLQQQQQMAFLNMNNPYQMPQMTGASAIGSNNPFGAFAQKPAMTGQPFNANGARNNNTNNTNSSLGELAFLQNSIAAGSPTSTPPAGTKSPNAHDEKYASLAMALSNRDDGMDTFGNTGQLRVPAHHSFGLGNRGTTSPGGGAANPFQNTGNSNNTLIDVGSSSSGGDSSTLARGNTNNPFQTPSPSNGFMSAQATGFGTMNGNSFNQLGPRGHTTNANSGAYVSNTLF